MPHLTQCQTAYTDEQEDDELFEFNGISTINNTNNRVIVYMHAGVFDVPAEDSSDDEAEGSQPLIRELDLDGVVAEVPDLLAHTPAPESQPTITPSQQHDAPGEREETERVQYQRII